MDAFPTRTASTLYLGVTYDEKKKMLAHAWLRCGDVFVTGAPHHKHLTLWQRLGKHKKARGD